MKTKLLAEAGKFLDTSEDRVMEQIQKWRDDLVSLNRRNRLLYFKHTKSSSLELVQPACDRVLEILGSRSGKLEFYEPPDSRDPSSQQLPGMQGGQTRPPRATEAVCHSWSGTAAKGELRAASVADLKKILRNLDRQARTEFMDRGLQSLYLGFGMVRWADPRFPEETSHAPIVLVPVELTRQGPGEPFRLEKLADDVILNPALQLKLDNDFGLSLPPVDDDDELGLSSYFAKVRTAVRRMKDWTVEDRTVLARFSYHKEVMYRDLLDNQERILDHPLVRALAAPDSTVVDFDFDAPLEEELDRIAPETSMLSILDADATQRRCIWAARDGRTFVMDGPPGTGKSQTIANMIAELLAAGRTVLFVSEKAAALEVVYNRLRRFGLHEYALQLHSHKATRRQVAKELSEAVSRRPQMSETFSATDIEQLQNKRTALSHYASAMNECREPLGHTLSMVIGYASRLNSYPRPAVDVAVDHQMSSSDLSKIREAAEALGRSWGPVERGEEFVWRDLSIREFGAAARARLIETLQALVVLNDRIAEQLSQSEQQLYGWSIDPGAAGLARVARVLEALRQADEIDPLWLTLPDLDAANTGLSSIEDLQINQAEAVGRVSSILDCEADAADMQEIASCVGAAQESSEHAEGWIPAPEWQRDSLSEAYRSTEELLRVFSEEVPALTETVCEACGISGWADPSLAETQDLVHLIRLAESADRPELDWLNPTRMSALKDAEKVLSALVGQLVDRREKVLAVFNESALQLEAADLKTRFAEIHHGFGKVRPGYLRDKKAIASATRTGRFSPEAVELLGPLAELQDLFKKLKGFELASAGTLGTYYGAEDTDFERLAKAIDVASEALSLAEKRVQLSGALATIARTATPDPTALLNARALEGNLATLNAYAQELQLDVSRLFQLPRSEFISLLKTVLIALGSWGRALGCLGELADYEPTVGQACEAGVAAAEAVLQGQLLSEKDEHLRALIGGRYAGIETDVAQLRRLLDAAKPVADALEQPVPLAVAERVIAVSLDAEAITTLLSEWDERASKVTQFFKMGKAPKVRAELEASTAGCADLLEQLRSTLDDIDEWLAHRDAVGACTALGLEALAEECIRNAYAASDVPSIIERVVLETWIDAVIGQDATRLKPMRANDRNALRAEFADLDEKLIRSSAGRVMAACNSRRPSKRVGAVATILREGEKKKRHMPIRELLVRTREDALALKPCFMMSPLSVSQFLPSDIQFDVVLFDEASQIRPHDAINCIYRGRQHVIAGDQKQLPPSIFFEGVREEEGDEWVEDELESYESILDKAKSCQSIRSLPLLWHYRSRHEDLITFSNVSFYDGELHSFPAPHNGSPLLGVGFHRVDGIYRRGTTSDNEIEAQRVAELVAVYAKEHPSLSLGVVAFSKAQGEAIENAIERMRIADPEVPNDYFCDERLNGFFVKNLETVQGDERDVIILSVGYGPDETGKLTLNFGPINQAGGFRRLNVAVTRARLRLELVASMTAGHIASAAENEGVRHLRNYLRYAEEGPSSLLRADEKSLGDVESVFEASVAEVIRSWGYEVATQVGSAGYRIDLTIVHPDEPGRHCLAVECDGAMYHSSRVARDRDRLRDAVLGGLGWRIHRIWGPAWYRQREQAEERLRQAIEAAVAHCSNSEVVFPPHVREEPEPAVTINTQRISEGFKTAHWVAPYTIGQPSLTTMDRAIQMGDRSASRIMKRLIPEVVRIEQPVCRELVLDRLKAAWGTKRAGKNVQSEFETAVSELLRAEEVFTDADGFLWVDATCPLRLVRRPVDSDDRTHRTCPQVAPAEFDLAVRGVLDGVTSIGQHELRRNVAELFGWERVGADIGKAIDTAVTRVLTSGGVESRILSDEAAPRVSANRETAEKAKGKPGVSRTPPASASRQSKPASQASLSDEDAAKCAICKGRFGERSRPTKLVFEESSGKVSKTAHSSCLEQLKGRAIRVPGYDWDGQRNALLPCPSAKSSVDGNTGAQKRAREAPPEKKRKKSRQKRAEEPVSTDIDLIREIERKNRARLEENKKKHGGLYDSTPWEQ